MISVRGNLPLGRLKAPDTVRYIFIGSLLQGNLESVCSNTSWGSGNCRKLGILPLARSQLQALLDALHCQFQPAATPAKYQTKIEHLNFTTIRGLSFLYQMHRKVACMLKETLLGAHVEGETTLTLRGTSCLGCAGMGRELTCQLRLMLAALAWRDKHLLDLWTSRDGSPKPD